MFNYTSMLGFGILVCAYMMTYILELIMKFPEYLTIQKSYRRYFKLTSTGFADALWLEKIIGCTSIQEVESENLYLVTTMKV